MQTRSALRRGWPAGVAAALALWAPAGHAEAAGDDVKGWYFAVDAALTQPSGLDQDYALQVDLFSSPVRSRIHRIDNDDDATFRGTVGYNFGLGLGSLQVAWWGFENNDAGSMSGYGAVVPTLFGYSYINAYYSSYYPGFLSGGLYPVTAASESKVEATLIDLDYIRPMDAGESFTVRWLAGLRVASFEEEQTFAGTDTFYSLITSSKRIEADGFGIKAGATAVYDFTPNFSVEGGVAASLLQAKTKAEADVFQTDLTGLFFPTTIGETIRDEDDFVRGHILDLDLRAVWSAGPIDVYAGYTVSSWEGIVRDPLPPRSSGFPFPSGLPSGADSRDGISFNSVQVGIRWRIPARGLAGPNPGSHGRRARGGSGSESSEFRLPTPR
jgi:hypothetical protein